MEKEGKMLIRFNNCTSFFNSNLARQFQNHAVQATELTKIHIDRKKVAVVRQDRKIFNLLKDTERVLRLLCFYFVSTTTQKPRMARTVPNTS